MFKFNSYVYLRYVLLLNMVAALVPATNLKGRANDPLLHAAWWKIDQHSAILVVAAAAILASALVFAATRKNLRKWWVYVGCGIVAGDFPATFYAVAAPDDAYLPLADMYMDGTFCGIVAGFVLYVLLRTQKQSAVT
jgi:hypothetical protein